MCKCKKFDWLLYADYIENRLEGKLLEEFVAHLKSCSICNDIVFSIKHESKLMDEIEHIAVPQSIHDKGIELSKNTFISLPVIGNIAIQSIGKYINIIKDTFSVKDPLIHSFAYRGDINHETITTIFGKSINLNLIPLDESYIQVEITLDSSYFKEDKDLLLFQINNESVRLLSSFKTDDYQLLIPKLKHGNYIIQIDETQLHFNYSQQNNIN